MGPDYVGRTGIRRPEPPLPEAVADLLMQDPVDRSEPDVESPLEDIGTTGMPYPSAAEIAAFVPPVAGALTADEEEVVAAAEASEGVPPTSSDPFVGISPELRDEILAVPGGLKKDLPPQLSPMEWNQGARDLIASKPSYDVDRHLSALQQELRSEPRRFELGQEGSWDPRTAELEAVRPEGISRPYGDFGASTGDEWEDRQRKRDFERLSHKQLFRRLGAADTHPWDVGMGTWGAEGTDRWRHGGRLSTDKYLASEPMFTGNRYTGIGRNEPTWDEFGRWSGRNDTSLDMVRAIMERSLRDERIAKGYSPEGYEPTGDTTDEDIGDWVRENREREAREVARRTGSGAGGIAESLYYSPAGLPARAWMGLMNLIPGMDVQGPVERRASRDFESGQHIARIESEIRTRGWENSAPKRRYGWAIQADARRRAEEGLPPINRPELTEAEWRKMGRPQIPGREGFPDRSYADGGIVGLENGGTTPTTPAPQQTQVTSSYVNPAIGQQTADLTDRIVAEGQRPYQQYTGQRIAGFTQPEAIAQQAAINYGMGMGPQGTQQAGTTLAGAGQMIQGAQQGLAGLQPQYQQLAGQFGTAAQGALGQAQTGAQGMQNLAARAELQGQLAGAGMRQTGAAAQTEQQALGAGQAAAGQAGQAQMTGLGQQMGQAGQQALGGQQDYAAGMTGMGTAAQQAGQAGQAQFGQIGDQAGQLGGDIRSQLSGVGGQSQQQAAQAAQRMRDIGGQGPELGKSADMSDYMSQYTGAVTDPQLRQLMEFQKAQGQELGAQAAGAGAFGGYRQGIMQQQQAQEGAQQAADIIGKGQQEAFQSAVAREQEDARRREQAQQVGLSAEQQAAAAQAGAQGQALQAEQAGGSAAQQGVGQQLQAAQQGQAAGQAGRAAQMQAQGQAAGMADVGAGRQMQGIQGQGALTGQGIGMGMQGLAAQQGAAAQGAQFGLQGQQQGYQAAQGGTQLGLAGLQQAGQLGQQGYGTMGQLMGQQQGAIGAQGGAFAQMGGMGAQLAGVGGQQMGLGAQQQRQQYERIGQMGQAGADRRALQQQSLNMGYQDWQNQQNQERQNIDWQQGAMNRLPYQSTVAQSRYGGGQPPQGGWQQIAGAGLTGAALANQMGS